MGFIGKLTATSLANRQLGPLFVEAHFNELV